MTRGALAMIAVAAACRGPDVPTSSGGESSDGAETSSAASTSAASTSSTSTNTTTTSSESSSESSSGPVTTEPLPPDPSYEDCEEPEALIDVMHATTPTGEIEIDEGWLGVFACSGVPYFLFRAHTIADAVEVFVDVAPLDTSSIEHPLDGSYPAGEPLGIEQLGTITFLEPVPDLSTYEAEPDKHVRALIVLDQAGWDFAVEVDFIHCGYGECDCPCE